MNLNDVPKEEVDSFFGKATENTTPAKEMPPCTHAHCKCMNLDGQCEHEHYANCLKAFNTNPANGWPEEFDELLSKLIDESGYSSYMGSFHCAKIKAFIQNLLDTERARIVERNAMKDDLLDDMWGLICNVNGGIIENEKPEWYEAFLRIREKYFQALDQAIDIVKDI